MASGLRARRCLERELGTALDEFAQHREAAVSLLGALDEDVWSRTAIFEDRMVNLREPITAMVVHDESHWAPLAAQLGGARKLAGERRETCPCLRARRPPPWLRHRVKHSLPPLMHSAPA